jgi:hypothetical protein
MKRRVIVVPQADGDMDVILDWLYKHSPTGAVTWHNRWLEVLDQLKKYADQCPIAPESAICRYEIRHLVFKTRSGREYRAIFAMQDDTVVVLHIRGPGQDIVSPDELREPPLP